MILPNQTNTFEDGTTQGWQIGRANSRTPANVASGGPDGTEDNFLRAFTESALYGVSSRLVWFNIAPEWQGDYVSAGVRSIDAEVRNLGSVDLVLRLAFDGAGGRFVTSQGIPLRVGGAWQSVSFSLDPSNFVADGGTNINATLRDVSAIRFLHNPNPQFRGEMITASAGIDNIVAVSSLSTPTPVSTPIPISGIRVEGIFTDQVLLNSFAEITTTANQAGAVATNFRDLTNNNDIVSLEVTDTRNTPAGVRGLDGNDRITGGGNRDVVNGNRGADTLEGSGGDDYLRGGMDNDEVLGSIGNDILNGNIGEDQVRGQEGNDLVRGGQGNDLLFGDEGNDVLIGDFGSDTLKGGVGTDRFILRADSAASSLQAADRILDFTAGEGDRIGLVGVQNLSQIVLSEVNLDNVGGLNDTAIVGSSGQFLGVVLNQNVATLNASLFFLVEGNDRALSVG